MCLGYFLTRSNAVFSGSVVLAYRDNANIPRIEVTDETGTFRVHFFDYPFDEYGVFNCDGDTKQFDEPLQLQTWIERRFDMESGWYQLDRMPNDFALFRNDKIGVEIGIYELVPGDFRVSLAADYFGPPIILE